MEDIKENQAELLKMKITMSKMKNTLDRINGRLDIAEERISELEDIAIEIIQNESQRGKKVIGKAGIWSRCPPALKFLPFARPQAAL